MENETEASRRLQRAAGKRLNRELTKRMFQKAEAASLHDNALQIAPIWRFIGNSFKSLNQF